MIRNRHLIRNGLVYDGTGSEPKYLDVLIENGVIVEIEKAINPSDDMEVIDASNKWVTPGFIDTHTHYDAEVIAAPSLKESVCHGVTSVVIGNCSISMILSESEDCSDLFTRVESLPRENVLPILQDKKTWHTVSDFVEFMDNHPLGPNVASFLGHSDLRTSVMGLERATNSKVSPTSSELSEMERTLESALEQGFLGLSTMTTKWDKLDGERCRSASLPSTYASWGEFKLLNKVLRRFGRVHQGAPNIVTKWNTVLFFMESLGIFRDKLKTTLITLMDPKATPSTYRLISSATRLFNMLGSDFKWQALPNTFEVYADGMDLVVFEEFGSGEAALHLADELERNALLKDESYRRWFRKDYDKKWGSRVWQRDFYDATIKDCPDQTLIGRSFGEIGDENQLHPSDVFLDLVVKYGRKLRWHTVIANHRPYVLEKIIKNKDAIISFADSGAHIRNMAYYNFPLRLLKFAYEKECQGQYDFPAHKAVYKLTGELADWFNLDVGKIEVGARADVNVLNPEQLVQTLDNYDEAPMEGFDGISRMVNRNPNVIEHVFINGNLAYVDGKFCSDFGKSMRFGSFLRANN